MLPDDIDILSEVLLRDACSEMYLMRKYRINYQKACIIQGMWQSMQVKIVMPRRSRYRRVRPVPKTPIIKYLSVD